MSSAIEDCFDCTDWNVFKEVATRNDHTDLEEYASSVTGYIVKCVDDVVLTRIITIWPDQRPWLNIKVHSLLKARDEAFRSSGSKDQPHLRHQSRQKNHMPPLKKYNSVTTFHRECKEAFNVPFTIG